MENYIMIDSVKIPLTDDQVKMMRSAKNKQSPFKRNRGKSYYSIGFNGEVYEDMDLDANEDCLSYKVANYCTDKNLMSQRALHETLNRLLWRFSMENGECENPWDGSHQHYSIFFHYDFRQFRVAEVYWSHYAGDIYFPSRAIAVRAIDEIVKPFIEAHPDFVW